MARYVAMWRFFWVLSLAFGAWITFLGLRLYLDDVFSSLQGRVTYGFGYTIGSYTIFAGLGIIAWGYALHLLIERGRPRLAALGAIGHAVLAFSPIGLDIGYIFSRLDTSLLALWAIGYVLISVRIIIEPPAEADSLAGTSTTVDAL